MVPLFTKLNTADQMLNRIQDNVRASVNPMTTVPLNSGLILSSVSLVSGANSINHTLGRVLQGWFPVRIRNVASTFYDTQDSNSTPALTLNLNSSVAVVADLFVF